MATHDYVIANQNGANFRSDLNNALSAIVSNNSSATEPSTTYAYQWWADTANDLLKIRNGADSAWVSILTLSTGTPVSSPFELVDDTTPQLGGNLDAQSNNITGVSNLEANGTIKLDGNYPTGSGNVALGDTALDSLTSGQRNTALGDKAGTGITSGSGNVAVGDNTMTATVTGVDNVAVGTYSLNLNTSGTLNTAVGGSSLERNTSGNYNTAIGRQALTFNTTAGNNTAVGYQAAYSNTTGTSVTAVGFQALSSNTSGSYNIAIGTRALNSNTTSTDNVVIGYYAGYTGTTSGQNTIIGKEAGYYNTGYYNTYLGVLSGSQMTTGNYNTIIGRYSGNQDGLDIRTSNGNIVLSDGYGNPRMSWNSYGEGSQPCSSTAWGTLYKGSSSTNYAILFSPSGGNAGQIYFTSSSTTYSTSSDYRLKENVVDMTDATTRLKQLQPKRFNFIVDADTTVDGFLAHEVQDIVPEAIHGTKDEVDDEGNPKYQGIDQSKLVPLLVATIKELEARITALESA